MASTAKHIILDCERMKYPHTGLYSFCKDLGNALVKEAAGSEASIAFYTPPALTGFFGKNAAYLQQNSFHKLVMPSLKKFDVWHATHQSTLYYPYRQKIPVVLTVHDLNFLHGEEKTATKQKTYISNLQKKVDRANAVVAISAFTARELEQHINLGNKKITVIYNGCSVDEQIVATPPPVNAAGPFLFSIGTIAPKKNLHVLPALLVGNNYRLIIAGITQSEVYQQKIIGEALKLGVADRLIFTGALSEESKKWYYIHCLAFVFPSIAEGFGLPVIEAMHYGKTVVLSKEGPLPEIAGPFAAYFEDFSGAAMRATLQAAIEKDLDATRGEQISGHARQYSWQKAANAYLHLYRTI